MYNCLFLDQLFLPYKSYGIVSLSDTNGWERVFTLCLKLFLDWNFPGNTIPPAVFWKKGPKVLFPGVSPFLGSKFVLQYSVAYFDNCGVYLYVFSHDSLVAYGSKLVFVGVLWTIWVFGLKRWRRDPGMQIKLLPFFSSVPVAAILDFKMAAIFNIFWPTYQLLSYLESSKWWQNLCFW